MPHNYSTNKTWQFLTQINEALDERSIETRLVDLAKPLGATAIFGGIVPAAGSSAEMIADSTFLQRFPPEWAQRYNGSGYVFRDPIVERLQWDRGPFSWADAYASSRHSQNVSLIDGEASSFGLRQGIVIPITLLDGSVAAVSFGGMDVAGSPDNESLLGFAASYAIGAIVQRRGSARRAKGRVSAREYDCLLWAAEGKSDWEISVILGISKPTVSKHILSAREKLGAVTKAHAIAIALREKILR